MSMPYMNSAAVWKKRALSHAHARLASCPCTRFTRTISRNDVWFCAAVVALHSSAVGILGKVNAGSAAARMRYIQCSGCSRQTVAMMNTARSDMRHVATSTNPTRENNTSTSAVKNTALMFPSTKSSTSRQQNLSLKSRPWRRWLSS